MNVLSIATRAISVLRVRGLADKAAELSSRLPAADATDAAATAAVVDVARGAIASIHEIGLEAIAADLSTELGDEPLPSRNLAGNAERPGRTLEITMREGLSIGERSEAAVVPPTPVAVVRPVSEAKIAKQIPEAPAS